MEYEKAKHWFTMSRASGAGNIKAVHLSWQHTRYFKRSNGSQKFVSSEVLHCRTKCYLCFIRFPFSQWCIADADGAAARGFRGAAANGNEQKPGETLREAEVQWESIHCRLQCALQLLNQTLTAAWALPDQRGLAVPGWVIKYCTVGSRVKLRYGSSWYLFRSFYCPK